MFSQKLNVALLVSLGAVAVALAGQFTAGEVDSTTASDQTVALLRAPAYIAVSGGTCERVRVFNPRAASGQVFYITGWIETGLGVQLFLPPELGDYPDAPMLISQGGAPTVPIPLSTYIDVAMGCLTCGESCQRLVLVGYYSAQPEITPILEPEA